MADSRLVGLVPAAGLGTRLGHLSGSKELLPLPVQSEQPEDQATRPVCTFLLEAMRRGGIEQVFVILRSGKWDIPAYLKDGNDWGMQIGYAIMRHPYGAPFTLDAAYPFVSDATVALGFPDTLIASPSAFATLLESLEASEADAVLGLCPTDRPHATDMVQLDADNRVLGLEIKRTGTKLQNAWCIAAWRPRFTEYLHSYVGKLLGQAENDSSKQEELASAEHYVGQVINAALGDGLDVRGVVVSSEPFLDIGTPETLSIAMRRMRTDP